MRHLIAKRNRLRDMIAELEGDPWLAYPSEDMRQAITDENLALMLLEIEQHQDLRRTELERRADPERDAAMEKAKRFASSLFHTQNGTKHALNQMQIWSDRLQEAQAQFARHSQRVRDDYLEVQRHWDRLTDMERAYLEKPKPHPGTALDFPSVGHAERGHFYPERTALQEGQLRKLREELERVERQCADEGT